MKKKAGLGKIAEKGDFTGPSATAWMHHWRREKAEPKPMV
jgi:hypothetical protein